MEVDRSHRKPSETITRQAVKRNPPPTGKRRRGRPRNTWQRDIKWKQNRWITPGERWRGWPRTLNSDVPWSMTFNPSEQTGINKTNKSDHTWRNGTWVYDSHNRNTTILQR